MHSRMEVPLQSSVFGRFCFAHAYRGRSEAYRQRNIYSKHTVPVNVTSSSQYSSSPSPACDLAYLVSRRR